MPVSAPEHIELSKAEDGDECPLCHSGTVEVGHSARVYYVKCLGECGTITRQHGQTDEMIRRRWGQGTYNEEDSPPLPVAGCQTEEEAAADATYVPSWAKPIG